MRAAAVVIFVGAALFVLGWAVICVRFIVTAPPDNRTALIGPNLGVITIAILILAPAVLLAIPLCLGVRGVRWPLSVVGVLYVVVSVMTLVGGEPLAIPFIVYSLLWLTLLWVDPPRLRKNVAS